MKGLFFSDSIIKLIRESASNAEARKLIGQFYNDKEKVSDPLKEYLLSIRNTDKANLVKDAVEEDGYFDANSYSGGKFDDAFSMGSEYGEASLVEDLLKRFYL